MSKTVLFGYITTVFQFLQVFGLEMDTTEVLSQVNSIWEAAEILGQLIIGPMIIFLRSITGTKLAQGLVATLLGTKA